MEQLNHEYETWEETQPTFYQKAKAILPPLFGVIGCMIIYYMAYKGYEHEYLRVASAITTVTVGSGILLTSVISWVVTHHPQYEPIHIMMKWNVKNMIPYVIFACAFYSYIKNNGDYPSYFVWVCIHTTLALLICLFPFLVRLFG